MRHLRHLNQILSEESFWIYTIQNPFKSFLNDRPSTIFDIQNNKREKIVLLHFIYGIALLYNLPSKAILYISATYGFSPGVSAPSSTSRAYTLTTYASAPMNATTTPMLNKIGRAHV